MKHARNATHWAVPLLLADYRRGADGPAAYDCWGLVRAAVQLRHGCELPRLPHWARQAGQGAEQGAGQWWALRAALQEALGQGWRPLRAAAARDGDILFMRAGGGLQRHVGIVLAIDAAQVLPGLLHAVDGGPVWQTLDTLHWYGYSRLQAWRLQC